MASNYSQSLSNASPLSFFKYLICGQIDHRGTKPYGIFLRRPFIFCLHFNLSLRMRKQWRYHLQPNGFAIILRALNKIIFIAFNLMGYNLAPKGLVSYLAWTTEKND